MPLPVLTFVQKERAENFLFDAERHFHFSECSTSFAARWPVTTAALR